MAFVRVLALSWADFFNAYVIWLMMPYLTDVWKLNFIPASTIVNLWRGAIAILPFFLLFLADTVTGNFWMLFLSSIACSIGMGLLSISTPPVLAKETGGCDSYNPHCISDEKRILFFAALGLIAFGISGLKSSLLSFLEKQDKELDEENISCGRALGLCFGLLSVLLIPVGAILSLSYLKQYSFKFGLPAILTTAATVAFMTGSCQYKREPPEGSPFTTIFRVFFSATSKMFLRSPNPARLYERRGSGSHGAAETDSFSLPHTPGLSCLDKAAIVLPNQNPTQQTNNRWRRLCRVTEVEETKIIIRMIPICLSFIICGLVSSIGHTYFISQANHLNRTDHGKHYPLLLLTVFCEYYKSEYTRTYLSCAKNSSGKLRKFGPPIGIGISMVFAIFCCVTAAKVENQRLDLVKSHGLIDKPDEEIPMSFFKLTPQFALLGVLDGIFQASVAGFFKSQAPPSLAPYMTRLSEGIRGVGIIGSVLSVFVIGKISERGGKQPSWFQDTLNKSRLDNYYWTLTVMVSVNLVFYILMAFRFDYKDPTEVSDSEQSSDSGQSIGFEETRQELAFQDP